MSAPRGRCRTHSRHEAGCEGRLISSVPPHEHIKLCVWMNRAAGITAPGISSVARSSATRRPTSEPQATRSRGPRRDFSLVLIGRSSLARFADTECETAMEHSFQADDSAACVHGPSFRAERWWPQEPSKAAPPPLSAYLSQ